MGSAISRLARAGGVLAFHGVARSIDGSQLNVTVELSLFERLLEACRSVGEFVPLRDLIGRRQRGRSTARMIALTFDDSYASVAEAAAAVLVKHAIPSTAFVVTQAARDGEPFWWDRLAAVNSAADEVQWNRFVDRVGVAPAYLNGPHQQFGRTHAVRQWILAQFAGRLDGRVEDALSEAEAVCRCGAQDRPMTYDALAAFVASTAAAVGPHTLTHPVIPLLGEDEGVNEIRQSHQELLERFNQVEPYFAVPFGLFDVRTAGWVRSAGLQGFLTLGGVSIAGEDRFGETPRICISTATEPTRLALRVSGLLDFRRPPRYPAMPTATT